MFFAVFWATILYSQAGNESLVKFEEGYRGPHWQFIKEYVESPEIAYGSFIEGETEWSDILVAFHDVNDDGQLELFFRIYDDPFCGTAECTTFVFQMQGGVWKNIAEFNSTAIIVSDEKILGYRTLYWLKSRTHWDGEQYVPVDLDPEG